jgi:hypothetical protein
VGIAEERTEGWVRWKYPGARPVPGSVEFGMTGYESNIIEVSWIEQDLEPGELRVHSPGTTFLRAGSSQSEEVDDLNELVRELLEAEWKLGTPAPPES